MTINENDRRPAGTGTVEELASGKFRFRLRTAMNERSSSPPFDTREEAQEMLDATLYQLANGNLSQADRLLRVPVRCARPRARRCARRSVPRDWHCRSRVGAPVVGETRWRRVVRASR
jgi:hypothetical protein